MPSFSTYLGNALLNEVLRNTGYTPAATVYISLHTADPGLTGASEVSGGAYARQSIAFAAASAKVCINSALITFPTATVAWGTITHAGIWDASTAGNFLFGDALTISRVIGIGDIFKFAAGDAKVTLT